MTERNRPIRTVSEELDILGRHPEGVPDVPDEIIEAFANEYEQLGLSGVKLGQRALELIKNDDDVA